MLGNPLVSTIIPAYNAEVYLADALASALRQTYPSHEIVVIDDGSTDGTRDILRRFGKDILWESVPNSGAPNARNRGLELARGTLVQFLDADDLLDERKLAVQVPLMLDKKADMVFCSWLSVPFDGSSQGAIVKPVAGLDDSVLIALGSIILTPTPLHWRENLRRVGGFSPGLPCCQDYDLHLRIACSGLTLHFHDDLLVTSRRRPGSVSSDFLRLYSVWPGVYRSNFKLLEERGGMTQQRAKAFAGRMALAGRSLARLGESKLSSECFRQAKRMHPSGGIDRAYDLKSRMVRFLMGPVATEKFIGLWQRLSGRLSGSVG